MTNKKESDIINISKKSEELKMRKVNYTVKRKDGTQFNTTSYKIATEGGNRIHRTFLTAFDERELKSPNELKKLEKDLENCKRITALRKVKIRKRD